MGDYELYTPWLKQKFDRHPRATVAALALPIALVVGVGIYKGVECLKDHVAHRQVIEQTTFPYDPPRSP